MPKDDMQSLLGEAKAEIRASIRKRQPTEVDGVLGPAADSAPMPPKPTVPRPRPQAESEPEIEEIAYEDAFGRREAPTKRIGGRRVDYPSLPPAAAVPGLTPSVMASVARVPLGRLLVLIAASSAGVTGVIAATTAGVVQVISALRPPSNADIERKLQAIETRVNGDFGMKLEVETRQKKDEEIEQKLDALGRAHKSLAERVPAKVKVRVNPQGPEQ